MKKFMMMAMAAAMTMAMNNEVNAAETSSSPETYEAATEMNSVSETRIMVHSTGVDLNKFEYTIDNEGRVSTKIMYRFDENTKSWMPVMMYRAEYGKDSNTLTCAGFNKSKGAFNKHAMKTTYSKSECPVLIALPECLDY